MGGPSSLLNVEQVCLCVTVKKLKQPVALPCQLRLLILNSDLTEELMINERNKKRQDRHWPCLCSLTTGYSLNSSCLLKGWTGRAKEFHPQDFLLLSA
jgi:hypothetical protein